MATQLYQQSVNGGEPRKLTTGTTAYSKPVFSPDGKALYASYEVHGDNVYNVERIARFAWPTLGEPTVVTACFDGSVASYTVSPDGRTIFFTAEDAGREKLYSIPTTGGAAKLTGDLKQGCYSNLAGATKTDQMFLYQISTAR